jgi:hypothetical protein
MDRQPASARNWLRESISTPASSAAPRELLSQATIEVTYINPHSNHPNPRRRMHPTDILPNLPQSVAREIVQTLGTLLPAPATATATERDAHIETAMATLAAYHPTDASEAQLAAQACPRIGSHRR